LFERHQIGRIFTELSSNILSEDHLGPFRHEGKRMLTSTAIVRVPSPAKYMMRLAKHFEHRITVQRNDHTATFTFPEGVCQAAATDQDLSLTMNATNNDTLARYQEVITRHLKQVAAKEITFEVEWSSAT
jgi:uncharacterized protein